MAPLAWLRRVSETFSRPYTPTLGISHSSMNRIQNWATDTDIIPPPQFEIDAARVAWQQNSVSAHAIFAPLHYEPNYAYPLLIWLHGPGDNERQLMRVMPLVSMRNYVAVAPRATTPEDPSEKYPKTFRWSENEGNMGQAEQQIFDCINAAQRKYHIAKQRIFIAGCQEGGTLALRLGMRFPNQFAGAACIGGSFPTGNHPLNQLGEVRQLPLLIAHGRDSRKYPLDRICSDIRLFHTAGLKVTVRQYPCGDDVTTTMLSDLNVWLMELVTGNAHQQTDCTPGTYRMGELN